MVEGCEQAIGEVGGFSLTVSDDLRLYLIQTAEKGLAWLNLIADGRAGHGSFRNDDNAVTTLAAAVARIGAYEWPHKITDAQRAFLEAVSEAFGIELDPDRAEETLARLGSIARMVGATMSNTANPTMLGAGYKHNVIPGRATAAIDGRFVPGGEDEFFATIAELLGDRVRYEVVSHQPVGGDRVLRGPGRGHAVLPAGRGPGGPRGALPDERGHRRQGLGTAPASSASGSPRSGSRPTWTSSRCSTGWTSGCPPSRSGSVPACWTGSSTRPDPGP